MCTERFIFSEIFGEGWEGRWTVSDWKKSEGTQGSWFASAGKWFADEKEDVGLQITEDSKFFGNEAEAATFAETEGWEVKDVGVHREEACSWIFVNHPRCESWHYDPCCSFFVWHVRCGAGSLGYAWHTDNGNAFSPISDNAGGIAERSQLDETDVLDAADNTMAAIGKGFAIGSAACVSLALFGAFCVQADITGVDILHPWVFTGLLFGAMMSYAVSQVIGLSLDSYTK